MMKSYYLEAEAPRGTDIDARNGSEVIGRNEGALFTAAGASHSATPVASTVGVDVGRRFRLLFALFELFARFDDIVAVVLTLWTVPDRTSDIH